MRNEKSLEQQLSDEKLISGDLRVADIYIRNVFLQTPVAIVVYKGASFIIDIINDLALEMWGTTRKEVEDKPFFEVAPELQNGLRAILTNVYTTGKPFEATEYPAQYIRNHETYNGYFNFNIIPIRDLNGAIVGITSIGIDVTKEVLAKRKMEESEKQLRQIKDQLELSISAGKIGVWSLDVKNARLQWSKEQCELYGITPDEFEQTPEAFWKFVNPADLERLNRQSQETFDSQKTGLTHQFRITTASGVQRWIESRNRIQYDAEARPEFITGINIDITEDKLFAVELEQKVHERTLELEENNTALQKMNIELEAFTYIASHDLQEPLRKIQTFAALIKETEHKELSEISRDYYSRMISAAARMQTLLKDLLEFSRLSTTERIFETSNVNKIIEDVKEEFKEVIQKKNAIIQADEMQDLEIIPFQFRQLFHNLISNALKFSKPGIPPHVIISGKIIPPHQLPFPGEKPFYHISFSDNGVGFDPRYSQKIFQVFQKFHGRAEYPGTGIGLAIVKKIVENHNGIINAKSELGKGTTFNIYLPV